MVELQAQSQRLEGRLYETIRDADVALAASEQATESKLVLQRRLDEAQKAMFHLQDDMNYHRDDYYFRHRWKDL
jgi:hypothetical protein